MKEVKKKLQQLNNKLKNLIKTGSGDRKSGMCAVDFVNCIYRMTLLDKNYHIYLYEFYI